MGNALFRAFIWRDMLSDLNSKKPILGFNFGKPFRSISLEILGWGERDWRRDGWISPHNSYLNMIYRAGVVGVIIVVLFFILLVSMIIKSIILKSFIGVLFCGISIYWVIQANFMMTLELPHSAIPFWSLFGIGYAYINDISKNQI